MYIRIKERKRGSSVDVTLFQKPKILVADHPSAFSMVSTPKQRLQQLSAQLEVPLADPGKSEGISKINQVAPDSAGKYVQWALLRESSIEFALQES